MLDFDPFEWARGVLDSQYDVTRILFATVVVFGGVWILNNAGMPNATLLAVIIGFGVLLVRTPRGA